MTNIALDLRAIDYVTEHNVTVRAWRAFVEARFPASSGRSVRFQTFVDPGAPFSVVPYSLWHTRRLAWTPLGSQLRKASKQIPGALTWLGVPCDLGTTEVYLLDLLSGIRTGPYEVLAKFARTRLPGPVENAAVLGMSFLADNELRFVLEGSRHVMTGSLTVLAT